MNKEPKQFLYTVDSKSGETIAHSNPEYIKYIQNKKYELYLKQSGIPDFYYNIDFKDYKGNKESKEYKQIVYYAENCNTKEFDHVHLYLFGTQGTQKSALMYNILKQCIRNGMKVKTILAGNLINKLMKLQGFNRDEEIEAEIKQLKECDIIGLDDVGDIEKSMQWQNSSLVTVEWDNFFREVLSSKTKIVMTSNFPIETFKQYFSESLYELLDRNTHKIHLTESVKMLRKYNVEKVFEKVK